MKQEIYHKRAADLLAELPDESVDLIFTDPPYWTLNKWRSMGSTTRLGGNRDKDKQTGWFETISETELFETMRELHRVLKNDRHCFIMCDGQMLKWVLGWAEEAGFDYYKPIVWDKVNQGMGYHLRCRHEFVVMLDKGRNRQPKNLSLPDIVAIPMVRGGYPTEKPVELPLFFIEQYANTGEVVLDPFFGSGSTLIAARKAGCQFVGSDISEIALELATNRIAGTLLKPTPKDIESYFPLLEMEAAA